MNVNGLAYNDYVVGQAINIHDLYGLGSWCHNCHCRHW